MKTIYYIVDNGEERKSNYKDWKYWITEFCTEVMDKYGNIYKKADLPIRKITDGYNPFGILIARRVKA